VSRWARIATRIWQDAKFLSLSDAGRSLWMYLLTCESFMSIPGVVLGGPATHAERLGWTVDKLHGVLRELDAAGLAIRVDFPRMIWLPNALKHQPPDSPGAVKAFSRAWDAVPETDIKHEIWCALRAACKPFEGHRINQSKATLPAFETLFPEPHRGPPADPPRGHRGPPAEQYQYQDQEQHQEQDRSASSDAATHGELVPRVVVPPKRTRREAARPMPDGWAPNATAIAKATALSLDAAYEAEAFKDHHQSKGNRFVDWDAAFQTWLRNATKFSKGNAGNGTVGHAAPKQDHVASDELSTDFGGGS